MNDLLVHNRRVIERYFEEAWNRGELDALHELIHPDYCNHSPGLPGLPPGPEGLKPILMGLRRAFPDLHFEIRNLIVTAEQVAVHCTMTGTHLGDLFGAAPTGKQIRVNQMQIEKFRDGLIVEHWRQSDDLGMMRQLGMVAS